MKSANILIEISYSLPATIRISFTLTNDHRTGKKAVAIIEYKKMLRQIISNIDMISLIYALWWFEEFIIREIMLFLYEFIIIIVVGYGQIHERQKGN